MKSFYIVINYEKPQASAAAGMVRTFLEAHGARVYLGGQGDTLPSHGEVCAAMKKAGGDTMPEDTAAQYTPRKDTWHGNTLQRDTIQSSAVQDRSILMNSAQEYSVPLDDTPQESSTQKIAPSMDTDARTSASSPAPCAPFGSVQRYGIDTEAVMTRDTERRHKFQYTDPASIPEDTECILVFGGDGSIIQTARDLQGTDIPLLGINMGYLGYLAQLGSDDDIEKALMELLLDAYTVESRMMLDGTVHHAGREYRDIALNDIVLSKIGTNVTRFELFINGRMIAKYSADGMVISTPTGSTAYNLSAGGPIAMPESELMILTPVAPHMLASRSIVLPAGSAVHIRISEDTRTEQVVSFDGDTVVPLVPGDTIDVSFSDKRTKLIQLDASMSFLDNINKRMQ